MRREVLCPHCGGHRVLPLTVERLPRRDEPAGPWRAAQPVHQPHKCLRCRNRFRAPRVVASVGGLGLT